MGYRTPSGTSTSRTTEGVFDWRCMSIDIPKRTLMKTEHVSSIYDDETVSVSVLFFTIHVSSSTDTPTLCALLAFVTTTETQKKKAPLPPERRTRTETYQQGFLKTVKFPSWHNVYYSFLNAHARKSDTM